jgi:glutamate/tyrosine decarboxylase-like PLP-dependent enzyme
MSTSYRDILNSIRLAFPQPISDLIRDAYLVQTVARALDRVDALKSELPLLGVREPLDYSAAQEARLADTPLSLESVTEELVSYLEGMTIWGHPRTQQNVVPPPTIAALIGMMIAELYNPNLAWDEYSYKIALAEVEVVAMIAALIGYEPKQAAGVPLVVQALPCMA